MARHFNHRKALYTKIVSDVILSNKDSPFLLTCHFMLLIKPEKPNPLHLAIFRQEGGEAHGLA